jgi:hypothetical protein
MEMDGTWENVERWKNSISLIEILRRILIYIHDGN